MPKSLPRDSHGFERIDDFFSTRGESTSPGGQSSVPADSARTTTTAMTARANESRGVGGSTRELLAAEGSGGGSNHASGSNSRATNGAGASTRSRRSLRELGSQADRDAEDEEDEDEDEFRANGNGVGVGLNDTGSVDMDLTTLDNEGEGTPGKSIISRTTNQLVACHSKPAILEADRFTCVEWDLLSDQIQTTSSPSSPLSRDHLPPPPTPLPDPLAITPRLASRSVCQREREREWEWLWG